MALDCAAYPSSREKPHWSLDKQEDGNRQAWAMLNYTSATPTLTLSH